MSNVDHSNRARAAHAVVIAGGGPTGLMLAAELALAGVDAAIVERRATQELVGSRAGGLHARTLEVLDQRGVAERFVSQGKQHPVAHFHLLPLAVGDLPTRHNYTLGLWQNQIERLLADWVAELGVRVYRGLDVTDFAQDDSGVDVALSDGGSLRADYLVGCDGGRSVVRKTAGIDFLGSDATTSWLIAEVETRHEPPAGMRQDAHGIHGLARLDNGGPVRVVLTERELPAAGREPSLEDLRAALVGVYGSDFGAHSPTWISRFSDATRQAAAYRARHVLLAGDAAHVHPPIGGQGLNLGVQDAVNLGWKLAQVVRRLAPDALLDTYHAERHPVAARVLRNTMAQVALRRTDDRSQALAAVVAELVVLDEPRKRLAAEVTGLSVRYELGNGHPLLGRRMPDLELSSVRGNSPGRIYSLLHDARGVLLTLDGDVDFDLAPWAHRIRRVDSYCDSVWELPEIGAVTPPHAVLIRPDGHVAWVASERGDTAGLREALTHWFGPAAS